MWVLCSRAVLCRPCQPDTGSPSVRVRVRVRLTQCRTTTLGFLRLTPYSLGTLNRVAGGVQFVLDMANDPLTLEALAEVKRMLYPTPAVKKPIFAMLVFLEVPSVCKYFGKDLLEVRRSLNHPS